MKEAIILAGGLGSRLKSIINNKPKPMAKINNRPFLEYIFNFLKGQNIKRVILSVGYKKEIIKNYFQDEFNGIKIEYSEEKELLGTGGAIKQALKYIDSEEVYVLNGDTFFDIELDQLELNNSKIIIALKEMKNVSRFGAVKIDDNGYIYSFIEKRFFKKCYINGGIYLIKCDIFDKFDLNERFSFEKFLSENFRSLKAKGVVFDGFFIDIGVPEDYIKIQLFYKNLKF